MKIDIMNGGVCFPKGFSAAGVKAGIKASGNLDLALLYSEKSARCFAAFTKNQVQAAPVLHGKEVLSKQNLINAIVVNSGNANACTGEQGYADAVSMAELVESELKLSKHSVLVGSTGVIGHKLPMEKIRATIPELVKNLGTENSELFAKAICTTDTTIKTACVSVQTSVGEIRFGGSCKGSGMIHPNMATMLAYITTDLQLPEDFSTEFRVFVDESFNAITVDGDMSTNDTCIILANGQSGVFLNDLNLTEQADVRHALLGLMKHLALQIVQDGEGATKKIEIEVCGARNKTEATQIAKSIATSNLVKCAFFGEDPNWGRIVSSAGASGVEFSAAKISLYFENVQVVRNGMPLEVPKSQLLEIVKRKEYKISLDLCLGQYKTSVFTCDLSYDYVKINAEYTT
ncbi:MAG: bifunctional glutamate N-acetyltransferase/amino-acid acetyltransferase ArgJ [Fibromonadaceae bacterium]|jgi:glutamate N-acetyltransferase/amino-acid N-acetyltransferase|nr:bifunctional glutamate N-acetyltransferase/amino-acid acetyltransferase ArgJ [Fibromonadaceae bacterium]